MGPKQKTAAPVALDDSLLEQVSGRQTAVVIREPEDKTPQDVQDCYEGIAISAIDVV